MKKKIRSWVWFAVSLLVFPAIVFAAAGAQNVWNRMGHHQEVYLGSGGWFDQYRTKLYVDSNADLVMERNLIEIARFGSAGRATNVAFTSNGASLNLKSKSTTVTLSGGDPGTTIQASNFIPAGSFLVGLATRVTTAITGGTGTTVSGWDLGDTSTADLYANDVAVAAGTTTNLASHKSTWTPKYYSAAQTIEFTSAADTFGGGVVRVTAYYLDLTAPTD